MTLTIRNMDTDSSYHKTMESLDLYWDMKLEPHSPRSVVASELFSLNETTTSVPDWLCDNNFANGVTLLDDEEAKILKESESMELLSDEDLVVEFLDLGNEECLLDQKVPEQYYQTNQYHGHIDVVSQPNIPITKVQVSAPTTLAPSAFAFSPQCEDSSLISQQLTPPQSPPQFDGYQQQQQQPLFVKTEQKVLSYASDATSSPPSASPTTNCQFNSWIPGNEIARETQLVDDIVNMRVQELQLPTNWQQFNDDCESQSSSSLECSSNNSSLDEEWLPEQGMGSSTQSDLDLDTDDRQKTPKKRTRAYGRGVEDRKIRKKEQNKNAATRYRQKKKLEMETVLGEEQILAEENDALRRTLAERRHELRYLRQLIREFYQGRKH